MKKNRVILWSLMLSHLLLYSNEIPNEKVTENPERKIGTIESKKLRDRAKMSLEINKVGSKKLVGTLTGSELKVLLPISIEKDTKIKVESQKKISLPKITNIRGRFLAQEEMGNIISESVEKESESYVLSENGQVLSIQNGREDRNYYVTLEGTDGKNIVYEISEMIRTLESTEEEVIDLGEAKFKIDKRLYDRKSNYWYFSNGGLLAGRDGTPENTRYPLAIKLEGLKKDIPVPLVDEIIEEIVSLKTGNTDLYNLNADKTFFDTKYKAYKTPSASASNLFFPINIPISGLEDTLVFLTNTGVFTQDNYTFKVKTNTGRVYQGKVEKNIDNLYSRVDGVASLDLTNIPKNSQGIWASGSGGVEKENKSGLFDLKFSSNSLLNMGSVNSSQVTTDIAYKNPSTASKALSAKKLLDLDLNDNGTIDIRMEFINEGMRITKLTNENINRKILITPKYNAVSLGDLALTLTNTPRDLGEIVFEIDARMKNISNSNWLLANGELKNDNGETYAKYSDMVATVRGTSSDSTTRKYNREKVIFIESINTTYDNFIEKEMNGIRYKMVDSNSWIALPESTDGKAVNISDYEAGIGNLVAIKKVNSTSTEAFIARSGTSQEFTVTAKESEESEPLYKGRITKKYVGKESYSGSGTIDITALKADGTKYIFEPIERSFTRTETNSEEKYITSKDRRTAISITGDFVDSRGVVGAGKGKNIANKIKVEKISNERSLTEDVAISENGELSVTLDNITFGIDEASGGLIISKNNNTKLKQVKISYYYSPEDITLTRSVTEKDVLLGEFTLNIEDLDVEIDGDGTLDFGNLAYTEEHKKQTREERYRIKNLDNKKVSFGVSKEEGEMHLISDGTPGVTKKMRKRIVRYH